jgi:hypothetical protein
MDELNDVLSKLGPLIKSALNELEQQGKELQERCCAAEREAYSWDLSAQKGAQMRLDEHQLIVESVERFESSVLELVQQLR